MDYDQLRLYLHLSRTLHFLQTSRDCHISASALSRAIQRLERSVGWPLFERDRRTVRLTAEGARFAEHARETLERWDALARELRDRSPANRLAGTIALFASVTACQSFLPGILSGFRERFPDIHIRLETGYAADALEMLAQGAVDVTVAALPDRIPASLVARVLIHTPLCFIAPASPCEVQRQIARRPIPWSELPIVLPASGLARADADRWFKRKRIKPTIYGEVPGSEAILALVSLGCGVGIVPRLVMDKSPLRAEVRAIDVEPELGEFRVGVCTQRRKLKSPLVRAFWDAIAGAVPALVFLLFACAARPARAVDPFEIQVYDGTANAARALELELHVNGVASGPTVAAPPELAPNHQTHFTLEPSLGVTPFWELGAYLQTALRPDGQFDVAGTKLRSKLVTPPGWRPRWRLGCNFEVSWVRAAYDAARWGAEIRPIIAWEDPRWLFAVNPIVELSFAGAAPAFAPAAMALIKLRGGVALGVEYYADFGSFTSPLPARDQEHYVFEVANIALGDLDINAGIGEGLTAASNDLVAKVIFGYRFARAATNSVKR